MSCNIQEIRRQLESMQTLLDTYEHCHVGSVTPEEKIVERVKKACIKAVEKDKIKGIVDLNQATINAGVIRAVKAIQGV